MGSDGKTSGRHYLVEWALGVLSVTSKVLCFRYLWTLEQPIEVGQTPGGIRKSMQWELRFEEDVQS